MESTSEKIAQALQDGARSAAYIKSKCGPGITTEIVHAIAQSLGIEDMNELSCKFETIRLKKIKIAEMIQEGHPNQYIKNALNASRQLVEKVRESLGLPKEVLFNDKANETRHKIAALLQQGGMKNTDIASELGCSTTIVGEVKKAMREGRTYTVGGFAGGSQERRVLTDGMLDQIRDLRVGDPTMSQRKMAQVLGIAMITVQKGLKELGLSHGRKVRLTDFKLAQIRDVYAANPGMSMKRMREILGLNRQTLRKGLNELGFVSEVQVKSPNPSPGKKLAKSRPRKSKLTKRIQDLYSQDPNMSIREIASALEVDTDTAVKGLTRLGLFVKKSHDARQDSGETLPASVTSRPNDCDKPVLDIENPATIPITHVEKDPLFREPSNEFVGKCIALTQRRQDIFEQFFEANSHRIVEEIVEEDNDVLEKILSTDWSQPVINTLQKRQDILTRILEGNKDFVRNFLLQTEMNMYH